LSLNCTCKKHCIMGTEYYGRKDERRTIEFNEVGDLSTKLKEEEPKS